MIHPKTPIDHNNETRKPTWPYGSFQSHFMAEPFPVFTDFMDGSTVRTGKDGDERGWKLYSLIREAAWQGINTNTYPPMWNDLTTEQRQKWNQFVNSLFGQKS